MNIWKNQSKSHLQSSNFENWTCKKPKTKRLMSDSTDTVWIEGLSAAVLTYMSIASKGITAMNTSPKLESH